MYSSIGSVGRLTFVPSIPCLFFCSKFALRYEAEEHEQRFENIPIILRLSYSFVP